MWTFELISLANIWVALFVCGSHSFVNQSDISVYYDVMDGPHHDYNEIYKARYVFD